LPNGIAHDPDAAVDRTLSSCWPSRRLRLSLLAAGSAAAVTNGPASGTPSTSATVARCRKRSSRAPGMRTGAPRRSGSRKSRPGCGSTPRPAGSRARRPVSRPGARSISVYDRTFTTALPRLDHRLQRHRYVRRGNGSAPADLPAIRLLRNRVERIRHDHRGAQGRSRFLTAGTWYLALKQCQDIESECSGEFVAVL
jgi:hypothetical protein